MSRVRGYTIVEVLVVISIIAILAAAGFAIYLPTRAKAKDSVRKHDLNILALSLEAYFQENFKYIGGNGSCSTDTSNFYTEISQYVKDGKVPVDPTTGSQYCYISVNNGKSYILYAKLENCSDPQVENPATCQTSAYNYKVTSFDQDLAQAPPPPPPNVPPIFVPDPVTSSCEVVIETVLDVHTSIDSC